MKIDYLKINGFGKLENKNIDLTDGINIIKGKNETGKSTICTFILGMLYGISKTKNGKEISDFEKYKPWRNTEFSGKIKYTLDAGNSFEIFRDFNKKTPIIYNNMGNDISKHFSYAKSKEINFFEQQVEINEKNFINTAFVRQQEIKINKSDTNSIIQKISNIVSTGDDNISYKNALEKINKMQTEQIGSERTRQRPINIVDENLKKLQEEKKKLNFYRENASISEKKKDYFNQKLQQLNTQKEKIKQNKTFVEGEEFENINKKVNIYNILIVIFMVVSLILFAGMKNNILGAVSTFFIILVAILKKRKSDSELKILRKLSQEKNEKYEIQQENIQNEINEINLNLHILNNEKQNVDEKMAELARIDEKIQQQENIKNELISLNTSYEIAKEALIDAYEEIKQNISPKFQQNLCEITADLTNQKYKKVMVNDKDGLCIETENGAYMPINRLSTGTIDEIYLALRISILEQISNEKMPIILDEAFVYFDDKRLENMLLYLQDKKYDNQIIIFSCSNREEEVLNRLKIEYNLLEL